MTCGKRCLASAASLAILLARPAAALPPCEAAAQAAERDGGIPQGLLTAIGQVESGRADRLAGGTVIWPWTVNIQGRGVFFRTRTDAEAFTVAALGAGFRSIDAGCFQINLQWHPGAFASVADAFDPVANARYAARFLASLAGPDGDWTGAAGRYHSATTVHGLPYRDRVIDRWLRRSSTQAPVVHVWYGAIPVK